jgi:hypothetical protein
MGSLRKRIRSVVSILSDRRVAEQIVLDHRNVAVNIRQSIVAYGHADTHTNDAGL